MNENNEGVGWAIASMVLGIIALVSMCCSWTNLAFSVFTGILAILGVIFASVNLYGHKAGKGMAIAGLVCSIIALVSAVIFILIHGAPGIIASQVLGVFKELEIGM